MLTHTAGLAYPWTGGRVVGFLLKRAERQVPKGTDLAGWCDAWASVPLLFEPGSSWNYSVASDVLGRVVEVASGLPLDKFLAAHIFEPLGMTATSFEVPRDDQSRLFSMYALDAKTSLALADAQGDLDGRRKPDFFSGGAGLVTSAGDYLRFAEMLRQKGELDGTRLLQASSVSYMTKDHMPPKAVLRLGTLPPPNWLGYGLGVGTTPPRTHGASPSPLAFGWSGSANTYFVVDTGHDLTYMFFTQLTPFKALPLDTLLSSLVYEAVTA
ncbi:MAG: serine hydrolase domain-containing protein [Acidimicrobiales bacterium]